MDEKELKEVKRYSEAEMHYVIQIFINCSFSVV